MAFARSRSLWDTPKPRARWWSRCICASTRARADHTRGFGRMVRRTVTSASERVEARLATTRARPSPVPWIPIGNSSRCARRVRATSRTPGAVQRSASLISIPGYAPRKIARRWRSSRDATHTRNRTSLALPTISKAIGDCPCCHLARPVRNRPWTAEKSSFDCPSGVAVPVTIRTFPSNRRSRPRAAMTTTAEARPIATAERNAIALRTCGQSASRGGRLAWRRSRSATAPWRCIRR